MVWPTLSSWVHLFQSCKLAIKEIEEPIGDGKPASIIFVLQVAVTAACSLKLYPRLTVREF